MKNSFAIVIIRSIALLLLARSLANLYPSYIMARPFLEDFSPLEALISVLFSLIIATIIWFSAPTIASRMLPDDESVQLTEKGLVSAGSFLLGVYWFMTSITPLLIQIFEPEVQINFSLFLLQGVSLVLILGNKYVFKLYVKLRE